MDEKIIKLIIEEYPLVFNEIFDLISPTIGIRTNRSSGDKIIQSKFGGDPEIPESFQWPKLNNQYLSFFCQINLTELKSFKSFSKLPKSGMLYFFMLTEGLNRYPNRKEEYQVIYINSEKELLTSRFSPRGVKIFTETNIEFFHHYTFPSFQSFRRLNELPEIEEKIEHLYDEICELTDYSFDAKHQILGHPQAVQGTVSYWWALNMLNYSSNVVNDQQRIELSTIERQFELLLQIDFFDENTNFSDFGGNGIAYFGILKEDLKNKNFDNISLVFQNT